MTIQDKISTLKKQDFIDFSPIWRSAIKSFDNESAIEYLSNILDELDYDLDKHAINYDTWDAYDYFDCVTDLTRRIDYDWEVALINLYEYAEKYKYRAVLRTIDGIIDGLLEIDEKYISGNKNILNEGSAIVMKNGKKTNLYYAIKEILEYNGTCRSKDLMWIVNDNWHNLKPLMSKKTPNGDYYFSSKLINDGRYWQITKEGYDEYVKTCKENVFTILPKPDYLNDDEEEKDKDNVHYVEYDMEVENMKLDNAKKILKENGYKLSIK